MANQTFEVKRAHIGDRAYAAGEERSANPAEVSHLVPQTLVLKRAAKPKNKAAKAAKNKAS
ncbi:hypothetical protein ACFFUB_02425 [Algimonas porphyrae]|uniref:Uncharacterized protein n=1 Tax=Algimonas porphyrae TaxID=1128113 RepID=A0ABQ5UYW3_9PROT|nr:hypothetical protein [Algimonas porphyrae]GLQ20386.1 hypothetical protein GCM10007854_13410 [Algimonas porphyrae]